MSNYITSSRLVNMKIELLNIIKGKKKQRKKYII